jgi:hypothetical protein
MEKFKVLFKRWLARFGAASLTAVLLSSCLKDDNHYAPVPVALISVTQASPDAPNLDVYLNNNQINFHPFKYGHTIDYLQAYTGERKITFYRQGTQEIVASDTFRLNDKNIYSAFLANTINHPEVLLITDTLNKPAPGNAGVRFINLSPDAPAADLAVAGGSILVSNKSFKTNSPFIALPGNVKYTFEVRQQGTSNVLATLPDVNINNGFLYTIWLRGLAAGTSDSTKLKASLITNAYFYQ